MTIITPQKYIEAHLVEYPILYCCKNKQPTKLKVYDQLFNVIGNGIRNDEELIENFEYFDTITIPKNIKDYYIYNIVSGKNNQFSHNNSDIIECFEHEKENYPTIKKWIEHKIYPFEPYPNFNKQYSLIYKCPIFLTFGNKWLNEAIWFYRYCYKWFNKSQYKKLTYSEEYYINHKQNIDSFIFEIIKILQQHVTK